MAKTIACIIARTVSTRLPLKVLRSVHDNHSLLDFLITRFKFSRQIDDIYICTSTEAVDDILEDVAKRNGIKIYRGSPDEVIERMISVATLTNADNVIRITGDNVFTSYEYVDKQIEFLNINKLDYCRLINVPIGATAEVIKVSALIRCYNSIDPAVSEYLLLFILDPDKYKCGVIEIDEENHSNITLTVYTPNDLIRTKQIIDYYQKDVFKIHLKDIINIIETKKIANSHFEPKGEIKLPYNKTIPFSEFQEDMENRIHKSLHLKING